MESAVATNPITSLELAAKRCGFTIVDMCEVPGSEIRATLTRTGYYTSDSCSQPLPRTETWFFYAQRDLENEQGHWRASLKADRVATGRSADAIPAAFTLALC